jgi:hypothetical protein
MTFTTATVQPEGRLVNAIDSLYFNPQHCMSDALDLVRKHHAFFGISPTWRREFVSSFLLLIVIFYFLIIFSRRHWGCLTLHVP